ncbi:MAG: GNVR domain-containing protein [Aquihabitans sp.]
MELNGLIPTIKRWIIVIAVATMIAGLAGMWMGSSSDRTFEARTKVLVGPLSTDSGTVQASGNLVQTYAELATSDAVLGRVSKELQVPNSDLKTGVRATGNSATRLLTVRARSHNAKDSAAIANAVTGQLELMGAKDPSRPEGQLRVIDPATVPAGPVSPRLGMIVILAALAGLLGSVTLVLLFEFTGDTAESADKVEATTGVPAIVLRSRSGRRELSQHDRLAVIATQADLASANGQCTLVTSASGGDGSGALALALAEVWAERRSPVVVLDAGSGEITRLVRAEHRLGLAEMLTSDRSMVPLDLEGRPPIGIVPAGDEPGAEAISVRQANHLASRLAGPNGIVVVHGGPPTFSAATLVWGQVASVTILAVHRFRTRRGPLADATTNLRTIDAHLGFCVLHDGVRPSDRHVGRSPDGPTQTSKGPVSSNGVNSVDESATWITR